MLRTTRTTSAALRLRHPALSIRLSFPGAFRLMAFASWFLLFPLGFGSALRLTYCAPSNMFSSSGITHCSLADLVGVSTFHIFEMRLRGVSSLLRGRLVSAVEKRVVSTLFPLSSVSSHVPMSCHNAASMRIHFHSPVQSFPSPIHPVVGMIILDIIFRFRPFCYRRSLERLGTNLDTNLVQRTLKGCNFVSHTLYGNYTVLK